jgi:hypothetical protein
VNFTLIIIQNEGIGHVNINSGTNIIVQDKQNLTYIR